MSALDIIEESIGSLSFVDAPRCGLGILKGTILNIEFIQEPTPRGMKKRLYPHQRTILHAMSALEQRGFLESKNSDRTVRIHTRMGILAEKLGSGKTIMILALIAMPPPPNRPITHSIVPIGGSRIVVEARFPAARIIRSTIVFVAAAVVRQWEEAVATFTNLSVFIISDLRGLRRFAAAPGAMVADIIIVKNGTVAHDIAEYAGGAAKRIHTAIAGLTRKYCFERVVYDDFDTVPLPRTAAKINALFTWFVSATCLKSRCFGAVFTPEPATMDQPLIRPIGVVENLPLFVIRNADAFVEKSTALGRPRFVSHSVKNDTGRMIGAMAAMAGAELIEMLSAGAIDTAAAKYGLVGASVADVFRAVLRENYDAYARTTKCATWIESIHFATIAALPPPPAGIEYHVRHFRAMVEIKYNYPGIAATAAALLVTMRGEIKAAMTAIERVKSSIADGDCPVCSCPLADDAIIILRCCGKILCQECATQSTNFSRRGGGVTGKCPACRAAITFDDIIFVGEEVKLDDIAHGRGAAEPPRPEQKKARATKIDTLIAILRGGDDADGVEIEMKSYGVIGGAAQLPDPPRDGRKYIIFTKHVESLGEAHAAIAAAGIVFESIRGTADQIAATVARFRGGDLNVLLIDGEHFSSGLNLQCATDLIFMLKMIDRVVEAQIIGRIQRIGRICRATVHYIQYEHERV